MSAALEAAGHGLEVLLVEEFPILGGSLTYARFGAEPTRAQQEHGRLIAEIEASPNITVYTDAVGNGLFADNFLPVIRGHRMCKVRAQQVVVAAGAFEQPMVFRNNDLPGIMLGPGAQRLMRLRGGAWQARRRERQRARLRRWRSICSMPHRGGGDRRAAPSRRRAVPPPMRRGTAASWSTMGRRSPRRSATATSPACAAPQSRDEAALRPTVASSSATAW